MSQGEFVALLHLTELRRDALRTGNQGRHLARIQAEHVPLSKHDLQSSSRGRLERFSLETQRSQQLRVRKSPKYFYRQVLLQELLA